MRQTDRYTLLRLGGSFGWMDGWIGLDGSTMDHNKCLLMDGTGWMGG